MIYVFGAKHELLYGYHAFVEASTDKEAWEKLLVHEQEHAPYAKEIDLPSFQSFWNLVGKGTVAVMHFDDVETIR